jgi:hypothetical protein
VAARGSGDHRPTRDSNWGEAWPLAPTENIAARHYDLPTRRKMALGGDSGTQAGRRHRCSARPVEGGSSGEPTTVVAR